MAKSNTHILKALAEGYFEATGARIECAILQDSSRVFESETLAVAIGAFGLDTIDVEKHFADQNLTEYIEPKDRKSFNTLIYESLDGSEKRGVNINLFEALHNVYSRARDKGVLNENQKAVNAALDFMMMALQATKATMTDIVDASILKNKKAKKNDISLKVKEKVPFGEMVHEISKYNPNDEK